MRPAPGTPTTPAWVLGAASTLDAPLLNDPVTTAVNFPVADGGSFYLVAADYADIEFVSGVTLTLTSDTRRVILARIRGHRRLALNQCPPDHTLGRRRGLGTPNAEQEVEGLFSITANPS